MTGANKMSAETVLDRKRLVSESDSFGSRSTSDPIVPDEWTYFCVEDVSWCGNDVTVIYDKTGERYGLGKGYKVIACGETVHESAAPERCFTYAR